MTDTHYRLPSEVATSLDVSPSTLRRWSNEFADYLTDSAGRPEAADSGGTAHRRYSDEDLESLLAIKGLLNEGLTYVQVARRLEALRMRKEAGGEPSPGSVTVFEPNYQESLFSPAAAVLADTIHTVASDQQLLLKSQQANRDLQTVLVQDNFALKEENTKLRNRMLELERDLGELRRLDAARRDAFDARIDKLEARLAGTKAKGEESEPRGCWPRIFG